VEIGNLIGIGAIIKIIQFLRNIAIGVRNKNWWKTNYIIIRNWLFIFTMFIFREI